LTTTLKVCDFTDKLLPIIRVTEFVSPLPVFKHTMKNASKHLNKYYFPFYISRKEAIKFTMVLVALFAEHF
jgi:hypothetical protein